MNKSLRDGAGVFLLLAVGAAALVGIVFLFVGFGKLGQALGFSDTGAGFFAIVAFLLCISLLLLVAAIAIGKASAISGQAGEDS